MLTRIHVEFVARYAPTSGSPYTKPLRRSLVMDPAAGHQGPGPRFCSACGGRIGSRERHYVNHWSVARLHVACVPSTVGAELHARRQAV